MSLRSSALTGLKGPVVDQDIKVWVTSHRAPNKHLNATLL